MSLFCIFRRLMPYCVVVFILKVYRKSEHLIQSYLQKVINSWCHCYGFTSVHKLQPGAMTLIHTYYFGILKLISTCMAHHYSYIFIFILYEDCVVNLRDASLFSNKFVISARFTHHELFVVFQIIFLHFNVFIIHFDTTNRLYNCHVYVQCKSSHVQMCC